MRLLEAMPCILLNALCHKWMSRLTRIKMCLDASRFYETTTPCILLNELCHIWMSRLMSHSTRERIGCDKVLYHTKIFLEPSGCRTRRPIRTWLLGPGARSGTNQNAPFCSRWWHKSNKIVDTGSKTLLQEASGAVHVGWQSCVRSPN